jgi:hypothetical protein
MEMENMPGETLVAIFFTLGVMLASVSIYLFAVVIAASLADLLRRKK